MNHGFHKKIQQYNHIEQNMFIEQQIIILEWFLEDRVR